MPSADARRRRATIRRACRRARRPATRAPCGSPRTSRRCRLLGCRRLRRRRWRSPRGRTTGRTAAPLRRWRSAAERRAMDTDSIPLGAAVELAVGADVSESAGRGKVAGARSPTLRRMSTSETSRYVRLRVELVSRSPTPDALTGAALDRIAARRAACPTRSARTPRRPSGGRGGGPRLSRRPVRPGQGGAGGRAGARVLEQRAGRVRPRVRRVGPRRGVTGLDDE